MVTHRTPQAQTLVEALTSDYAGLRSSVSLVACLGLDMYAHNAETVEKFAAFVTDRCAGFRQSLRVLKWAKEVGVGVTKTSLMLGVAENDDQALSALRDIHAAHVDIVTFGQYMRPTKRHTKVE